MSDLRQALNVLVERPPVTPVSIDVVAARAGEFTKRRRATLGAVGLALVAFAAVLGMVFQQADRSGGINVASSGSSSARYIAIRPGGYVATGSWRLSVIRDGRVMTFDSRSNDDCAPLGLILPGDVVEGSILGPNSSLRVGEEFMCGG